jgi:hypothetical protein
MLVAHGRHAVGDLELIANMLNPHAAHAPHMYNPMLSGRIKHYCFHIQWVSPVFPDGDKLWASSESLVLQPRLESFESTTRHTRRGPQIVHVPVPSTPQSTSRNSSPSKKRTWSPGELQDHDDDGLPSFQEPKRSRHTGKVE